MLPWLSSAGGYSFLIPGYCRLQNGSNTRPRASIVGESVKLRMDLRGATLLTLLYPVSLLTAVAASVLAK